MERLVWERMSPSAALCFLVMILFYCDQSFASRRDSGRATRRAAIDEGPHFLDYLVNQTVPAGREVRLACRVRNLGDHKVAWIRNDPSAILAVNNHVITRNNRISVSHDGHMTWYLKISDIRESDGGVYLCQINTEKPITRSSHISVVVPPDIIDSESSSDVIVREKGDVTLKCKARGSPSPRVYWERVDPGKNISINESFSVQRFDGEALDLQRVSRSDMGDYQCFASNGVPPSRTKRIRLNVDFPPLLSIQQQIIGAPLGATVVLECITEAHPDSLNFWTTADGSMIYTERDDKFKSEVVTKNPSFIKHMKLTIYNLEPGDFGGFKCVAKNPIGETEGTITIKEKKPPRTEPPSTTIGYYEEDEIEVKEYWLPSNEEEEITSNEISFNAGQRDAQVETFSRPPRKKKNRRKNNNLEHSSMTSRSSERSTLFTAAGLLLTITMVQRIL